MHTSGKTLENFDKNSLTPTNSMVRAVMNSSGVYDKRRMKWFDKFVRFPGADPFNAMTVTKEYLFFTKPNLHLLSVNTGKVAESLSGYSFFVDAVDRYKPVCEQLQLSLDNKLSYTNAHNPFMSILSNTVKTGIDLPDIESENDQETGANVYGTKLTYRGNSYTSDQDCSFSLEFEDTKYLEVYMLFKIYDEYCRYKNMGLIELSQTRENDDDTIWINYTLNKILHDQFSVYKFVVGEDGMTIIYWAKYTGVYPTGVPRSALSDMNNEEGQKITVDFKAQFVRDMDPAILGDFNRLALGVEGSGIKNYYRNRAELPLYNTELKMMDGSWSSMPYIIELKDLPEGERMGKYILKWKV